jgi:hypothetical protein
MFCDVEAREMGVSMVTAAWGEGLMCACVPPPPRQIARHSPKTCIQMQTGAWTIKENMFYAVGAPVMAVLMVIAAWGEGVNVCLCTPLPLVGSLVVCPKHA